MKNVNKKENKHDFLSLELLVPNMDKVDCNRGYMFSGHFSQCSNLKNPEKPLVYTNFENQFGSYSDLGFNDLDENTEVLAKIVKNENVYFLFIHKLNSDTYDIIERRNEFWLTEKYGFTYNNDVIDSIAPGDVLDKGTRLYKSYNYDECDNFQYGTNIKVAFFTEKLKTLEDAIVISKEAAEKFTSYNVEKVTIVLNNNDLLLNLNEDPDDEYKCFPNINEDIENFLCVRRRINLKKIYSFDDLSLNSLNPNDEKFYSHGKITDIDIYSNMDEEDLELGVYNKQIRKILKKRKTFNKEFIKATEDYIKNESSKCSSQLIQTYNRIKMELDKVPFSYESSVFSGMVIEFTILKENKLSIGSKLSGRYGKNK